MNGKRYATSKALLRYIGLVFSLVAFAFLFFTILYTGRHHDIKFAEIFFNSEGSWNMPHVYGFVAQVLICLAGVLGLLIVFIDSLANDEKRWSYIAGITLAVCGTIILFSKVLFCAFEGANFSNFHLYGTTIASGCLAILAGAANILAYYVKD